MRLVSAIAAAVFLAAAQAHAKPATSASIPKLQKLAAKVRALKKGVVVVPKAAKASKIASRKSSKAASKPISNNASRATALRSLYRQMASLDYRAARTTASLPKKSQLKIAAGLRRLLISGERAGIDTVELDDPDADAELAQACNACPSGTTALGDDTYGLCYCADTADAQAATASADTSVAALSAETGPAVPAADVAASTPSVDVAVSTVAGAALAVSTDPVVAMDTTIARLSRFEKIASRNLASNKPKALRKAKIAPVAEWHYQRAQVFERMAAAATKPAFPAAKIGKDGKPSLARVPTSSQLRKLAARLRAGAGPVTMAKPAAKQGGYTAVAMPRSVAVRNTYAMMAALDLRAARVAGLPPAQARAARAMYGRMANLTAGGRVRRKAARKAGAPKAGAKKAGARFADDEGGGDEGGGEVDMGVEPTVYVEETPADSGSSSYDSGSSSSDSSYASSDTSYSWSDSSSYDSSSSDSSSYDSTSYDSSSSDSSSYADTSSDSSYDSSSSESSSYDSSSYADTSSDSSSSDSSSYDSGSSDSGGSSSASSDALAYGGADDNSGFGDTGLGDSQENALNDPSLSGGDSAAAADAGTSGAASDTSYVELDERENAVNDTFSGTALTDQGAQDPGSSESALADLTGSAENAVADTSGSSGAAAPADWSDSVGQDQLQDSPNDQPPASPEQAPDMTDSLAAATPDTGNVAATEPLDGGSCSEGGSGHYRKAGKVKAGNGFLAACYEAVNELFTPDSGVPQLTTPSPYAPVNVQDVTAVQPDPIPNPPSSPLPPGVQTEDTIPPNPLTPYAVVTQDAYQSAKDAWGDHWLPGDTWYACVGAGYCSYPGPQLPPPAPETTPAPAPNSSVKCDPSVNTEEYMRCTAARQGQRIQGLVRHSTLACGAKGRVLHSTKAGLSICSAAAPKAKIAGMRKAHKPLYSHLARLDRVAMKVSRGLADRQTPRSRKALLLYQRGQLYARMALAVSAPPRAARRTASKPAAKKSDVAKSAAKPKAAPKPAKPIAAEPAAPAAEAAPTPEPAPAPAADAPAAPSEEEVLKKDVQDMNDMEKEMRQQIQQRQGQ